MRKKIFASTVLLCVLTALAAFALALWTDYDGQRAFMQSETIRQAGNIKSACLASDDPEAVLSALSDTRLRITLIARDGTVLFDSTADEALMDNHQDRPEVEQAFASGTGSRTRLSDTLGEECFYYAQRLDDDTVLRVASYTSSVWAVTRDLIPRYVLLLVILCLGALWLASHMTRKIVQPLNELDLEHPLENDTYEEIAPLLGRIYRQNEGLRERMSELQDQREHLSAITASMAEGLIVLDSELTVLSCNQSALRLLGREDLNPVEQNLLVLCREAWVSALARRALAGERAEQTEMHQGRALRVLGSPASSGCILLISDVTEQQESERMRREFTANVSHELKTPLTSISGYAELIETGMARPGDVGRFAHIISDECSRLLTLVDDILSLSRLDEGAVPTQGGPVGLLAVSHEAVSRLTDAAQKRGITLSVEGDEQIICASRSMLLELICNLCDNAVKYNRDGGSVTVTVGRRSGRPFVSVRDTGIGIPADEQSRIFERFYRVDKSRSREVGGTGLGLAIVKHLAMALGAEISVDSTLGAGSTFTVTFAVPSDQACQPQ
ncbi:MAG TPA: PAS domain-containing protein [Candidatus Ventrousia excrementavium]|uniref:histidine kinase n=1 Tax=Candidatus Ventrousia excrementavium TaxID=2840961 RepID=A0A9D1IVN3_9CLOT|nr:PAS domain-containing protein [Candidatus Ventrousia excrementavium]